MFVLIFFIVLALLVLSHEFGHFLFAKLRGIKVEEFGFGFPPRLFGFRKGETLYSFNLIPFGGFVKIFGEDETDPSISRSFAAAPIGWRALVISAGILFNFLLAWVLFSIGFGVGMPSAVPEGRAESFRDVRVAITEVFPETPAATAGLEAGDYVTSLEYDGQTVTVARTTDVQQFISRHRGETVTINIDRNGAPVRLVAVPAPDPQEGRGALGIAMAHIGIEKVSWYHVPWRGLTEATALVSTVGRGLFGLLRGVATGSAALGQVVGPVGIAMIVGDVSRMGFLFLLQLVAFLSVHLALINLIPFPGLDGGRLLFLLIEFIRGSPVSRRISTYTHTAGFIALLLLMALITYHDIVKL
ncbi:MAG: site-2 protease family protein [Parcubacteria group bacterium]|nr:site-2 protease family protein [Parcubacteria group bacterium]